jgi:polygalacturonase
MNKKIIICLWILFLCTNILQAKIYNVKDFGAVGDGQHIDSEAINQAIVQAAREGGGTIYVPAGKYACYSIRLASQIHLYLEQGATVVAAFPTAEKGYDKAYSPAGIYIPAGEYALSYPFSAVGKAATTVAPCSRYR